MELGMEIDPKGAQMIEINILQSPNKEEYTRICVYPYRGYNDGRPYWKERGSSPPEDSRPPEETLISLETSHSSILPEARSRAPETAPVHIERGENITLRIFIDKSIVEVFINHKQCVAARVYPGRDDSIGVSLRSQGNASELISLDAWQMKNIYESD